MIEQFVSEKRNIVNRIMYLIQTQIFRDFYAKLTPDEKAEIDAAGKALDEQSIRQKFLKKSGGLLETKTLRELRILASEYGIEKYSKFPKDDLIVAITQVQHDLGITPPSLGMSSEVKRSDSDAGSSGLELHFDPCI